MKSRKRILKEAETQLRHIKEGTEDRYMARLTKHVEKMDSKLSSAKTAMNDMVKFAKRVEKQGWKNDGFDENELKSFYKEYDRIMKAIFDFSFLAGDLPKYMEY